MNSTQPGNSSILTKLPFHYGWVIMVCGTLTLFSCLGLGRFSLGMLLPAMGKALELSYSQMGVISTANFMGYLAAVLIASKLMNCFGARKLIFMALCLVGFSMMLISKATGMAAITFLYVLTGVGSALANIPVMALIATWFGSKTRGKASGFVVIGNGIGILLSGQLIPFINSLSESGWRVNWFVLGTLVIASAIVCFLVFKNSPEEMGLRPIGEDREKETITKDAETTVLALNSRIVLHCAAVYFLFGFTYVVYVTFMVTAMVHEHGYAESAAGVFWSWVGLLSLLSGPIPGSFSDKFGRKAALGVVFSIQAVSYLCMGLPLPEFFLYISIFCFGIVAWAVPSIIAALVADYSSGQRVATIFGFVTFIFGIGQISGPYLAGLIAEKTSSFSTSFLLASFFACLGVILSLLLPATKK